MATHTISPVTGVIALFAIALIFGFVAGISVVITITPVTWAQFIVASLFIAALAVLVVGVR